MAPILELLRACEPMWAGPPQHQEPHVGPLPPEASLRGGKAPKGWRLSEAEWGPEPAQVS